MHPDDAAALHLRNGDPVEIESRRGTARSVLRIDPATPHGSAFMPIHWNELWSRAASPNEVTTDATDPVSRQPALKYCAVSVRPARPLEGEETAAGVARTAGRTVPVTLAST